MSVAPVVSPARAWDALARADERVDQHDPRRRSLNPAGGRARSLVLVHRQALRAVSLPPERARELSDALAEGLVALAGAQLDNFPENLFWDFDYLAVAVVRDALRAEERAAAELRARFAQMVRLHERYGRHTPINFRYVHDFTYGFDWAKWVGRDPTTRARVGPYDRAFLQHMERRGAELLELIASNDSEYPTLTDERPRNPFGFSREPDPEALLHTALARDGLVPVEVWRVDARPDPTPDYTALRAARARALGLALDDGAAC